MGSVSLKIGDGTARFRRSSLCSSAVHLVMLASVLVTNLFALYAFTSSPPPQHSAAAAAAASTVSPALADQISAILREIELSERKLHQMEREIAGYSTVDPTSPKLPPELRSFLSRHPLPLGRDSRSGITELASSVAHSCVRSPDLLSQLMSYRPYSPCPSADSPHLPLKLLSLSCDPLPRRRCLSFAHPTPSPAPLAPSRWARPRGKNDFPIESVLPLASSPVRIGLDLIAASADFAAAMAPRNVTILTTSPTAVHAEGLLSLLISPLQRLPFYDNIFDLVHVEKGVEEGGAEAMEFFMFDVDRVLRPRGLFWLDNYYCADDEKKRAVTRLIERFGYKKLKWVVGEKGGSGKAQVYLSAVLQKPVRG